MYQALYRKWRPKTFDDVVGQEHITRTLKRQISANRLSHAYLFVGTRGTGKTSCAKILAKAVNCLAPRDGNPCNECAACRGIDSGSILDVLELDAASNNGVDNVRALREEAVYTPAAVKRRVYIVDEVHMLTSAAFNALLKILEEPPEHLLFILATTELHKVPATILSRCQRFSFKRLTRHTVSGQIAKVASGEGFSITADAAEKLARLADGSMRDALSLLDQCASDTEITVERVCDALGLAGNEEFIRLCEAVLNRQAIPGLTALDLMYRDGKDLAALLSELSAFMRDLLIYSLSPDSRLISGSFDMNELKQLSRAASHERLFYCMEIIRDASYNLTRGTNARSTVETCVIKMCSDTLDDSDAALLSRIARLEAAFNGGEAAAIPERTYQQPQPGQDFHTEPDSHTEPEFVGEPVILDEPGFFADEDIPPENGSDEYNAAPEQVIHAEQEYNKQPEQIPAKEPDTVLNTAPEPPPEPAQKQAEKKPASANFWRDILKLLSDDAAIRTLLGDRTKVTARLDGAVLTVEATDAFTVNMIGSEMIMNPLKEAAQKTLGHAVTVKVTASEGKLSAVSPEDAAEKLERLSAFDVIKFE